MRKMIAAAQPALFPEARPSGIKLVQRKGKRPRKSPDGVSTNDLVFSASVGNNADIFPSVLALYVPSKSVVADVTFGKGVFWKNVPKDKYTLLATDAKTGIDSRALPYAKESIDCVVFDPPYMHTPGGTAHDGHQNFERYYKNNGKNTTTLKYHEAVLDLYFKSASEAWRVLKPAGIYIVKCQDEVCACRQRLTHVEIINHLAERFIAEDLFVLVRNGKPGVSRILKQRHARKNHSYFLVFRKRARQRSWVNPVELLVEIIKEHVPEDIWQGSPLIGYRQLGNTNRGEIGEEFVRRYLKGAGIPVSSRGGRTALTDMQCAGCTFEVKTASLGANGTFQFNHVRLDRKYDYLLCLGICPQEIVFNMWRKGEVAEEEAGHLVRMAEGQSITHKITKKLIDMRPIADLPGCMASLKKRPKRSRNPGKPGAQI